MKKLILILSVLFFLSCKKENVPTIGISPNGDGINDCLILPLGSHLIIFHDGGAVAYQSENYQNDFCGQGLADGVYFYSVNGRVGTLLITR